MGHLDGGFAPVEFGEARIGAHAQGRGQIMFAQIARGFAHDVLRLRNFGHAGRDPLRLSAKQSQALSPAHLSTRGHDAARCHAQALLHGADARRFAAVDAKRTADVGENVLARAHRVLPPRSRHCAWNVLPWGAGMSR